MRGSSFYVYLPTPKEIGLADLALNDGRDGMQAPRSTAAGETVLFVEDEVRQLHLMQTFLQGEGYRVLGAKDGVQALEVYLRHKDEVSVVVLDIGLPKLNGWEAFLRMRQVAPEVKVIFATGYISAEMETGMARGDLSGLIMKPYQLDDVLAKISHAIRTPLPGTTGSMPPPDAHVPLSPSRKMLGDSK